MGAIETFLVNRGCDSDVHPDERATPCRCEGCRMAAEFGAMLAQFAKLEKFVVEAFSEGFKEGARMVARYAEDNEAKSHGHWLESIARQEMLDSIHALAQPEAP